MTARRSFTVVPATENDAQMRSLEELEAVADAAKAELEHAETSAITALVEAMRFLALELPQDSTLAPSFAGLARDVEKRLGRGNSAVWAESTIHLGVKAICSRHARGREIYPTRKEQ